MGVCHLHLIQVHTTPCPINDSCGFFSKARKRNREYKLLDRGTDPVGLPSVSRRRSARSMAAAAPVNLNNEVVKLRKDVKKARTLIIRKLTRNITQLKAKKGTKDAILKNLRRAERLLEEIHTMKRLAYYYILQIKMVHPDEGPKTRNAGIGCKTKTTNVINMRDECGM
ncbi:hypothetical protein scyTo_0002261 [Scyliorhinus torazame]|uniref:Uncharacterized protein n=1 Tax=Scyliorhinus torazame TaxID=75743 RepID=A0A401PII1_SCYTO|nr:hypothetical protein [Scyliorhinus torazame]